MQRSRLLLFCLLLAALNITALQEAHASHMMGSSLNFQNLGSGSFRVNMIAYRDCNGIPFTGATFTVTPSCGSSFTLSAQKFGGNDVTPVCKKQCTRCGSKGSLCSFPYGVEKYYVTATTDLSSYSCCNFNVSFQECCRNGALTTIAPDNYYIEGWLDKCNLTGNSPAFEFDPIIVTCNGQCVRRVQSAKSQPGDSLIYSLTKPLINPNTPAVYNPGYSYLLPFKVDSTGSCAGFNLNSEDGSISFRPVMEDASVFAILVDQWQKVNGKYVQVSQTRQDMQTAVFTCPPNTPPDIAGIDSNSNTVIHAVAGFPISFKIPTYDADGDTLRMAWNNGIPSAAFSITGKKNPLGIFKWTPAKKDARTLPYRFVVTIADSLVCPIPSIIQKSFTIYVADTGKIKMNYKDSGCSAFCFYAEHDTGKVYGYTWLIDGVSKSGNPSFCYTFPKEGKYAVVLKITTGGYSFVADSEVIEIKYPVAKIIADTSVCLGDSLQLFASGGKSYSWNKVPGITHTAFQNPWVKPLAKQTYTVTVTDSAGCTATDSITIKVNTDCVWPGDANRDRLVDYNDLFNIGLAFNSKGPKRPGATIKFVPQICSNWNFSMNGIDDKHIDTDGDGVIGYSDTNAIVKNYGLTHLKRSDEFSGDPNGIPLYFKFSKDTFYAGDVLDFSILLGNSQKSANGVYGAGFRLAYNGNFMADRLQNKFNCSLLCASSGIPLALTRNSLSSYSSDLAIVRTDQKAATGFGSLTDLEFTLKDSSANYTPNGEWIYFYFQKARLIDKSGNDIPVHAMADSVLVLKYHVNSVGKTVAGPDLEIYPNPTDHFIYLETASPIESVHFYNYVGQELRLPFQSSGRINTVDVSGLPQGIYSVMVKNKEGIASKRILVN